MSEKGRDRASDTERYSDVAVGDFARFFLGADGEVGGSVVLAAEAASEVVPHIPEHEAEVAEFGELTDVDELMDDEASETIGFLIENLRVSQDDSPEGDTTDAGPPQQPDASCRWPDVYVFKANLTQLPSQPVGVESGPGEDPDGVQPATRLIRLGGRAMTRSTF